MKKVKTILLSLMIVMATAFMSACSCGSSGGEGPVVPEKEITISCEEFTGSNVNVIYDPVSKELDIKCNVGDTFTIEYLLSPSDATTTRVRWEIEDSDANLDVVKTEKANLKEYSKTINEKVVFVANNKGSATIKFITESNKTAIANIQVGGKVANLPALAKIETGDINYNATLGRLSWNEPTKMITPLGQVLDISEEAKADISHYEVVVTNLDEERTETINVNKNIKRLETFEKGVRYSVTIKAIGGSFAVTSGAVSDPFKFCQLQTVNNLTNNNGNLSFQSPKYSAYHYVYSNDSTYTQTPNMAGNSTFEMNCSEFPNYNISRSFNISVKSFPAAYDEQLGYGKSINDKGEIVDDVRYYPSINSATLTVVKLPEPQLTLENITGTLDIGGVSASNVTTGTTLYIDKGVNQDYSNHNAKYQLIVYRYSVNGPSEDNHITSEILNPSINKSYNLSSVLLNKLSGGNKFNITVQMVGDSKSTIISPIKILTVTVPAVATSTSWGLYDNYLTALSDVDYSQIELHFVDSANNKVITKTIENTRSGVFNLQELNIDPGTYKLFGRYIGSNINNGTISSSLVAMDDFSVKGFNLYIPSGISSYIVKSNGDFTITKPTNNHSNSIYQLDMSPVIEAGGQGGSTSKVRIILYNAEDTANISTYEDVFNIGNSDGAVTTGGYGYTLSGDTITFNIFTAIKEAFDSGDMHFDDLFERKYAYNFTAKAYGINGDKTTDGIDSVVSSTVTQIERVKAPTDVAFDNNIISFPAVTGATAYRVYINDGTTDYEALIQLAGSNDTVNIDITTQNIVGSASVTLSSILNNIATQGNFAISFKAIGQNDSSGNGTVRLDSAVNTVYFGVTSVLKNVKLTLDLAGNFTWTTPYSLTTSESQDSGDSVSIANTTYTIADANVKYIIYFYNSDGSCPKTITLTPTILADGEELLDGMCAVTPKGSKSNAYDTLTVNINDELKARLQENPYCSIVVKEYVSNQLMGAGTEKYYVSTLDITNPITKVDGNNIIYWDEVDGADSYDVFVNDDETPKNVTTNYINVSDLCPNKGVYEIKVMAKAVNGDDVGSEENPFYLYGEAGIVNVYKISAQITTSVNNLELAQVTNFNEDFIEWNNICTLGTSYTITINGNVVSLTSDGKGNALVLASGNPTPFTSSKVKLIITDDIAGYFRTGDNEIIITPTIDFGATGYLLVDTGNLIKNNIVKMSTPEYGTSASDTITTVDGNIVVYVDSDTEDLIIEYCTDGESFAEMSHDLYTITTNDSNSKMRTITLNLAEYGDLYIRIKAVKKNSIYSDYLVNLVSDVETPITKLATVGDFSRDDSSGTAWFTWSPVEGVTSYELVIWKTVYETIVPDIPVPEPEPGEGEGEQGISEAEGEGEGDITDDPIVEDDNTQNVTTPKTITFTVTKSGNSYTCVVNDGVTTLPGVSRFTYDVNTNKFKYIFDEAVLFDGKGSGDYHFTIRPLTTTNGYLNGSNSSESVITKLNNQTEVSVAGGVVSVSGYTRTGDKLPTGIKYTITPYTKDAEENTTFGTVGTGTVTWGDDYENHQSVTIDLLQVSDGSEYLYTAYDLAHYNFNITIVYLGDGSSSVDSDVSSEISLERFEPSKLSTVDGVVAIQKVDSATSYIVEIVKTSDGEGASPSYVNVPAMEADVTLMTELIAQESGFTFEANTEYTLRVQTCGGKLNSAWSEPFKVIKLGTPTEPIAGKGIYIDNDNSTNTPRINWANNSLNTYHSEYGYRMIYTTKIGDDMYQQLAGTSAIDISKGATAQSLVTNLPTSNYYIRIRTQGTTSGDGKIGYLNSDYTTGIPVNYISETGGLKVKSGQISWNSIEAAKYYTVLFKYMDSLGATKTVTITTNQTYISTDKIPSDVVDIVTVVVTTITNPASGIISTYVEEGAAPYTENVMSIYKPSTATDYKILSGRLSWTIDLSDISNFVNANPEIILPSQGTEEPAPEGGEGGEPSVSAEEPIADLREQVVKYVVNKINNKVDNPSAKDFELQISHLINVNLKMNEKTHRIIPDYVELLDASGNVIGNIEDTTFISEYWQGGYKLRYYYNVVTDRVNPNKVEGGNTNTTGYVSGNYSLQISLLGNSGDESGSTIPALSSTYTTPINAYKLLSPETYTRVNASSVKYDIETGKIYWTLVNNGIDDNYYTNYAIEAYSEEGSATAYITIDTSSSYMVGTNIYYQHVLDLFAVDSIKKTEGETRPLLLSDTKYEIRVYASGTVDSTLVASGAKLYLNSNSLDYINEISILDKPVAPTMALNNVLWKPAETSTLTRVRIYGPFTPTATGSYKISADTIEDMSWSESVSLEGLTPYETLDFGTEAEKGRINAYTLTNKYLNNLASNPRYATGGYVFTFQEVGDGFGVVDSLVSDAYSYYKLDKTTSVRIGSGEYNGMYVWDDVQYANAYCVRLYRVGQGEGENKEADTLVSTVFTSNTYYDLPDFDYEVTDEFYILVQACKVNALGKLMLNIEGNVAVMATLETNWFMGDEVKSSINTRLAVTTAMTITNSGNLSWLPIENAGSYTIVYNHTVNNNETKSEIVNGITMTSHQILNTVKGKFTIKLRTIVKSDNTSYLNSRHSKATPLMKLTKPDPVIVSGNLKWIADNQTGDNTEFDSQLIINYKDKDIENKIIINDGDTASDGNTYDINLSGLILKYFTDITKIDISSEAVSEDDGEGDGEGELLTPYAVMKQYKYNNDLDIYPEGPRDFSMQYIGNTPEITISAGENNLFMISSETAYLTASKLPAPSYIDFAKIDLSGESKPVNRLFWSPVPNAKDYNIFVFSVLEDGDETSYSKASIANVSTLSGYKYDSGFCYYDISSVLVGGANNFFFIQAVGGSDGDNHYLSSSYSDYKVINAPPTPENLSYKGEEGVLNWTIGTSNKYNIGLILEYTVKDVTADEYYNYWAKTASDYAEADKIALRSEIKSRTISYSGTALTVVERILLEYKDYGSTPTSYKLNAIAKYTKFTVFALAGTDIDNPDTNFKSEDVVLENIVKDEDGNCNNIGFDFEMFHKGDGSIQNPYIITSEEHMKNIAYFKERAFKLDPKEQNGVKKITFAGGDDPWEAIRGDFTGSIDGNGVIIDNYKMKLTKIANSNYIMAFVENNKGTIKNITFNLIGVEIESQEEELRITTITITNEGTLENITINGGETGVKAADKSYLANAKVSGDPNKVYHIYLQGKDVTTDGVKVGGLVVTNKGTINGVAVNINIVALGDDKLTANVGGIAYSSSGGTITNTSYSGDIIGNRIGGIVYLADNVNEISNCTVGSKDKMATLVGKGYDGTDGKYVYAGGLIGLALTTAEDRVIKNCYTYVNIKLDVATGTVNSNYYLGGLVAQLHKSTNQNLSIISSEVVVSFEWIGNADYSSVMSTRTKAYRFTPGAYVTCSNCKYKCLTSEDSFSIENTIPSGVTQNNN